MPDIETVVPLASPLEQWTDAVLRTQLGALSVSSEAALSKLPVHRRTLYLVDYENPYIEASLDMQRTESALTDEDKSVHSDAIERAGQAFIRIMQFLVANKAENTCFRTRSSN